MHRMTVGMVETTRRKTRFPTIGTTIHAKAKPPSATTAFCIYFITLIDAINSGEKCLIAHSTSSSNSVGVAFPQPRVAGEARYPG